MLLLNTDLHVAELANRMSRNQFVRNTMTTIQLQLQPSGMASSTDLTYDDWSSVRGGSEHGDAPGNTVRARAKRSDSITSWNSVTREALVPSSGTLVNSSGQLTLASSEPAGSSSANQSAVSVGNASEGKQSQEANPPQTYAGSSGAPPSSSAIIFDRNWESEIENMLKVSWGSHTPFVVLNCLGLGNIQRRQGPADSPSHREYSDGAFVYVIAEPPRYGSSEPKCAHGATGPPDNSQAREHSGLAIPHGCTGPQPIQ